jgi:hypothetical protein
VEAEMGPEPDPQSISCRIDDIIDRFRRKHPALGRIHAHIWLSYYLPICHPIRWWRHMNAINDLRTMMGLD